MELVFFGKENEANTVLFHTKNTSFMLNCGVDLSNQLNRVNRLNFVIITDANLMDGLDSVINSNGENKLIVFIGRESLPRLLKKYPNYESYLDVRLISDGVKFSVDSIDFMPIKIDTANNSEVFGLKFFDIMFVSPGYFFPEIDFIDINTLIHGPYSWFDDDGEFGKYINRTSRYNNVFMVNNSYPEHLMSKYSLNQYFCELDSKSRCDVVTENSNLILNDHISHTLFENKEGIVLMSLGGDKINKDSKSLIIKPALYKNKTNKFLYYISNDLCYGILKLHEPTKITINEFDKLYDKHKIDTEHVAITYNFDEDDYSLEFLGELDFDSFEGSRSITKRYLKCFPNKQVLWSYEFDVIEKYDIPKLVRYRNNSIDDCFVENFELIELDSSKIDELNITDESKSLRDLCILNSLKSINSSDNISEKIDKICENIDKLDESNKYNLSYFRSYSGNRELSELRDTQKVIDNFISLGIHSNGTSEVIINSDLELIKNKIELCVKELTRCSDVVWGVPSKPHDKFYRLYDLNISKASDISEIRLNKSNVSHQLSFAEIGVSDYSVDEIETTINYIGVGNSISIERVLGDRVILKRNNNVVNIYNASGNIIKSIDHCNLSSKDFVLDCYLQDNGNIIVSDVLSFDGNDFTNRPLHERKHIIHSLNYSNCFRESYAIVSNAVPEIQKAIALFSKLKDTQGILIKSTNSKYHGGYNPHWVLMVGDDSKLLESGSTTTGTTGIADISGKQFVKTKRKKRDG